MDASRQLALLEIERSDAPQRFSLSAEIVLFDLASSPFFARLRLAILHTGGQI